jgi:outer membrane protein TolC
MDVRILAAAAALALSASMTPLPAGTAPLALADLPDLVLASDAGAVTAARSVEAAYHAYRGTVADAMPQVDLSTGYSLGYTPSVTVTDPVTAEITDYAKHGATARLSVSQLLPTAGNLVVSVEDALGAESIGSGSVSPFPPVYPDPDFSQKPKATVQLSQPVLLNGKLIDLDLFPATKRKAELGWEKERAAGRVAANRAIAQAVQFFLSVVQTRQAAAQMERAVELAGRRLAALADGVRLGTATETDLLDARIANGRQRQTLLDLRSSLARTERLLAAAIGRESLAGVELAEDVPAWTRAGEPAGLGDAALRANASILQSSLALEERRADDVIAGQRHAATLTLLLSVAGRRSGEWGQTLFGYSDERTLGQSFSDLFAEGAGVDWSASANLNVPLYDGGKRREDRAASAALTASVQEGLASRQRIVIEDLAAALERRSILEERVELLAEAVDLASRRLATEGSLLGQGRSTDNDVQARRLEAEARRNDLRQARADLLLANLDIASLAGDDLAGIVKGLPR